MLLLSGPGLQLPLEGHAEARGRQRRLERVRAPIALPLGDDDHGPADEGRDGSGRLLDRRAAQPEHVLPGSGDRFRKVPLLHLCEYISAQYAYAKTLG